MLVDSSKPLVDSRVEEVSSVDSEPNPSSRSRLEDLKSLFYTTLALRLHQLA